jgi:homoserine kinase
VAVGYDALGCAFEAVGDRVRVERLPERTVEIRAITGLPMELPRTPEDNTAAVALLRLIEERELDFGFGIEIEKGIPLGSGMGGSAASAVAAIRAASALLDAPLDRAEMLHFALQGEAVASGAVHADNVAPSLYGGLVLTRSVDPPDVIPIPVPDALRCVLVRPDLQIATRDARAVLPDDVPLQTAVQQSANLAGLIAGCLQSDFELIGRALRDVMIEPHRKGLIPAFDAVQQSALDAGALGCSISGAGPSLFAWCRAADAKAVHGAMRQAFDDAGVTAEGWVTAVTATGAHLVDPPDRT